MQTTQFLDLECVVLENSYLSLLVTKSAGPRILSLSYQGGENLFAELKDVTLECPGNGQLHLFGGHRLWHSPEYPERTYLPDDEPVDITSTDNGLKVTQKVEIQTGIQKSMTIYLPEDSSTVFVEHTLTNQGLWSVECAAWAITQVKRGGTAILPQCCKDTGVLANRSLAIWPYTDMKDPHILWGNDFIFVDAERDTGAMKLGFPNPRGWIAYWINGYLFVKKTAFYGDSSYFDFGSSSQCYCNHLFLELETLSPISKIEPGASISHVETWEVYRDIDFTCDEDSMQGLAAKLSLE